MEGEEGGVTANGAEGSGAEADQAPGSQWGETGVWGHVGTDAPLGGGAQSNNKAQKVEGGARDALASRRGSVFVGRAGVAGGGTATAGDGDNKTGPGPATDGVGAGTDGTGSAVPTAPPVVPTVSSALQQSASVAATTGADTSAPPRAPLLFPPAANFAGSFSAAAFNRVASLGLAGPLCLSHRGVACRRCL